MNKEPAEALLIQRFTENGAPLCLATCSSAAIAETATERIEPNMREFSGSRNGCAGVPATTGLSSSGDASDMSRHNSAQSGRFERRQLRSTAPRNVRA